jgi:hypothetical protein
MGYKPILLTFANAYSGVYLLFLNITAYTSQLYFDPSLGNTLFLTD